MTNFAFGGSDFAFYETLPGGAGARPRAPGRHAVQTHMTNTRNTPIEEFEARYPVRVVRLGLRVGSGGAGARRGGDGLCKVVELLGPMRISLFADRQRIGPPGLAGGESGATGETWRRNGEQRERLPGKWSGAGRMGDQIEILTPGGGGHGAP